MDRFGRLERLSTSPGALKAWLSFGNQVDVIPLLGGIAAPTLILRRLTDALIRPGAGLPLVELIPKARLIEYPDGDHTFWTGDTASVLRDVEQFVTTARGAAAGDDDGALATVLSVALVPQPLADGECIGRALVERHGGVVRYAEGPILVATFDRPARALRCARALRAALRGRNGDLRAGLHMGPIDADDGDGQGATFRAAERVRQRCGDGEILLSRVVADLVAGSSFDLAAREGNPRDELPSLRELHALLG